MVFPDVVSKAKTPRKHCATPSVLCPPTSVDKAFRTRSLTSTLSSSSTPAEASSVTTCTPEEEATEQVMNLTHTSGASQEAFAPPPAAPPSLTVTCVPSEGALPTPASADTVSHTPAPTEVVLPPIPASMNRVAPDATTPGYASAPVDVAASPAPLPALTGKVIRSPAPIEAACHISTSADEAPEPVSDVHPNFGIAEHGTEECPSGSDMKEVLRDSPLVAGDTPPALPASEDTLFSSANPSTMQMVGPPLLLHSGWLSVVGFLVLDTQEVREFVEQLPTKCWRPC